QIALAIQRLRTKILESRHLKQLYLLNDLSKEMTGLLNARELFNLVAKRLCREFGYLNCTIFSWTDGDDETLIEGAYGVNAKKYTPGETRFPINEGLLGKVLTTKSLILANDVSKNKDFIHRGNILAKSEIGIPLILDETVLGAILVNSHELNAFEASEISTLNTLADQLSISFEKLRLFETEKYQREHAETLREVVTTLSKTTDINAIYQVILEQLKKVVPYDGSSIMLLNEEELIIKAASGDLPASVLDYSFNKDENTITHPVINDYKTTMYNDVRRLPGWLNSPGSSNIISWIGAPLIVRGECIGVLTVDGYSPNQFSQSDIQLVSTFASQAASALDNARLFDETNNALEREQQLNQISRRISENLESEFILEDLMKMSCAAIGADSGLIALLSPNKEQLQIPYIYNSIDPVDQTIMQKDEEIVWQILQTGESLLLDNYSEHPKALARNPVGSIIGVPLYSMEEIIGVLILYNHSSEHIFSARDLAFVKSIGRQTGVAIQNIKLFTETQRRTEELSALYDMALASGSLLDTETLLEQLQSKIQSLLNPDGYSVSLYSEDRKEFEI
ncbi:MAG: GAF domain-containing protein, partial [Chloroflexota bacterium]